MKIRSSLFCFLLLTSCGPTFQDIQTKYNPDFQKMREKLAQISEKLPPVGSTLGDGCALPADRKPIFVKDEMKTNMEIMMSQSLKDPDSEINRTTDFDLILNSGLIHALQHTGPKNPMSESVLKKRAYKNYDAEMKHYLDYDYVLVNRVSDYQRAQIVDGSSFLPGYVKLDAFLFDLKSAELLCSFAYEGKSADTVSYSYKTNESNQLERAEAFANSSIFESARAELKTQIKNVLQTDVEFD